MANLERDITEEVVTYEARRGHAADAPHVAVVTEASALDGLARGLSIFGYNTSGYLGDPASEEDLGRLTEHVAGGKYDAAVFLLHPTVRKLLLETLDGRIPLVLLDTGIEESPKTSESTQILEAPALLSELAESIGSLLVRDKKS